MKAVLFMDSPVIATGYASTCRLTAKELSKRNYEVYGITFNGGPQLERMADWYGIKLLPNHALKRDPNAIYGDALSIVQIFTELNPDIMFFHNDSYRYSYLENLPQELLERSVFWLPFEGESQDVLGVRLFSKCAATRFVTKHALDIHKDLLTKKDIGYIPHAVDLESYFPVPNKFAAKVAKNMGLENKFVVLRIDRHQPRKYWNLTLQAFAAFAKDKEDVFLLAKCNPRDIVMYNESTKEGMDLEKLSVDLGIRNKVFFDDFFFSAPSMAQCFYHAADVFLTTTSGEGFGLCAVEAMACGLPVICPKTPVLPEVCGDGALLCNLKGKEWYAPMNVFHNLVDVDDVAAKLQWAYEDWKKGGAKLTEIGMKGRSIVDAKYSPKVVYDAWDSVFKDVSERRDLVSIVTVLYNVTGEPQLDGDDGIGKFRDSIEKYVKHPYEWIIVDNGSPAKAETKVWLETAAKTNPRIKPVYLDNNLGFAGGCNAGIAKSEGKWIILANPDSEALDPTKLVLPADFVKMMLDKAKSDPKIGIVGMELNQRDDILPGAKFPYFCNVLITKNCLDACKLAENKWLDESFWPAYYEDLDISLRAMGKDFKVVSHNVPFWHKSGGTNKYAIEGGKDGPYVKHISNALEKLATTNPDMAEFGRKRAEIASQGMQGLIAGNIHALQRKWGLEGRQKIKIVWDTHIGAGVGFSQIAEGLIPELHKLGFDLYINDWSNGSNVEDPLIRQLIEKTRKANEETDELDSAIHIVCWLMETFMNVDSEYKIGISFCESTKVRPQYLQACNAMDRILTFSDFCRNVQINSGFTPPIHVVNPGVHPIFTNYHERPKKDKFTFLAVGVAQDRKDTHRLVDAFCEAFPKNADYPPECEPGFPFKPSQVELVIKSNNFGALDWIHRDGYSNRANVRTIFTGWDQRAERKDFTMQEMYDLYCSADCLVHPSHGEGIGLPILEAAAIGLPVIFTNWSSPAEYLDESNSYPCSLGPNGTDMGDAYVGHGQAPGENGKWANCFVAGTPVRTTNGMKNIEDIQIGDLVLTHKGRYKKVVATSKNHYSGKAVRLQTFYNNYKLVATEEHPFLLKNGKFIEAKYLSGKDVLVTPFICQTKELPDIDILPFIESKRLRNNNKFVWSFGPSFIDRHDQTRISINDVAKAANVSKSVVQRALSNNGVLVADEKKRTIKKIAKNIGYVKPVSTKIKRHIKINQQFGRLCGFYLAEGCASGRLTFSFHRNEKETYGKEVLNLMHNIFGVNGKVYKNGDNGIAVTFCSSYLCQIFSSLFNNGSRNKAMPDEWMYGNEQFIKGLLYGLWHGDGTKEKYRVSFKTSSSKLAYQISALLLKLKIENSININKIGQYQIFIQDINDITNILEINQSNRKRRACRIFSDDNNMYVPIRKIEHIQLKDTVYNLEVEEDNTYCVANAIVHNCHIGHLKHQMRHVIRNPEEAREKGKRAAALMKEKYNWSESARQLMPLIFEWEAERKKKVVVSSFDPLTFVRPTLEPVKKGDRVLIDCVTRDRHSYLCGLITSLLGQTFKDWDIIIQCDDADESMPTDHQIMSLMTRCFHEGHSWRIIRSHRQGPHIAHDRTLQMAKDDPRQKYKLICRIDDDIYVRPDYLEKLFDVFLDDKNADVGAVGGVYLDPKRHDNEQMAPANFESSIDYAGKIDHNVPWPYICPYPEGTPIRSVEHLYSSFMYRVEAAVAIGGYCRRFSQIGHREESDFSYRFHLGGWKLFIQPKAIGFHFCAPAGGIRSNSITEKNKHAESDHKIYQRRITRWKKRAELRQIKDAEKAKELPAPIENLKVEKLEIVEKVKTQPKVAIVINGGNELATISKAVCRFGEYSDEIYVTCQNQQAKDDLQPIKYLKMIATTPEEVALLTKQLLAEGDHEFIMTVTDLMYFESNPLALINDAYDDYVFEIFRTYEHPTQRIVGPECQNACIITRRRENAKPKMDRILYCEMPIIEDNKLKPNNGKSLMGKELISIEDMSRKNWTKICTYQYPEGKLLQPRQANVIKTETLVSIVIPTAGRLQCLKRCLNSIYSHTTTPFEIIIVDNDSSDGTAAYLESECKIRGNLKVFPQSVNHGYQKAINIGLGKANGEYILLFNDDAWVAGRETDGRDWLQVYVDELKANQKLGLIGPHGCESPALGSRILFFWCVMFRKSLYDKVGPLDDITFWNYGGDDDYAQRVREAGFEIKELITNLRHDMNHVPDYVKKPELEESVLKLRAKYKKT